MNKSRVCPLLIATVLNDTWLFTKQASPPTRLKSITSCYSILYLGIAQARLKNGITELQICSLNHVKLSSDGDAKEFLAMTSSVNGIPQKHVVGSTIHGRYLTY